MPTNDPQLGAAIHAQNISIRLRERQIPVFIFYTTLESDYILWRRRSINGLGKMVWGLCCTTTVYEHSFTSRLRSDHV